MERRFHLTPVRLTVLSFFGLIVFGTILLMLPIATAGTKSASLIDAFFTSVSAVCVTGLVVQDTGTYYSTFGQGVILLLIQLGGIGIMTLYASLPVIFGQQLRLSQRRMFEAIFDADTYASLRGMVIRIIRYTIIIELIGACFLTLRFHALWNDFEKALYYGLFHSISAFCNAGFMLFSNGLEDFSADPLVNLVIISLYVLGGLGFAVIYQIIHRRSFKKFSANAKMGLIVTAFLIVIPCFLVFHFEFDQALNGKGLFEKSLVTLMQVTSTRTAGFNSIDLTTLNNSTLFIFCILMFIGASPGGTGGGVKTTTVGLMFLSIRSIFRGQADIEVFGRMVPKDVITRSIAIIAIGFSLITMSIVALMMTENNSFEVIFFEVISAFGTVGLSLGLTSKLTLFGKAMICLMMFVGRIGTLSLIFILGSQDKQASYQYPVGKFMVG